MSLESVWNSKVPPGAFPSKNDLPLSGQTFAIKDNIVPTAAGCRVYSPALSAPVVQRLIDAGATPIGKTNMNQEVRT